MNQNTVGKQSDFLYGVAADRSRVYYQTVKNAGHFSFLSPFPQSMQTPSFLPAQDPPGFDREQFHERLTFEIIHFLSNHH
ncbi:hypothetical protein D3C76_425950 [compost metagenome]